MFALLDRKPEIEDGPDRPNIQGSIELQTVSFHYPTRPNVSTRGWLGGQGCARRTSAPGPLQMHSHAVAICSASLLHRRSG